MKIYLFLSLIFFSLISKAQWQATTNDVLLVKAVAVKNYRGSEYQINVDVKSVATDGEGKTGLLALQIGKTDWDFIEKTRKRAKQIKNSSGWQKCRIAGTIDERANKLWLYLLCYGNGDFYFDNIELAIKANNGLWIQIPIKNGNFEKSTLKDPFMGLQNGESLVKKTTVAVNLSFEADTLYRQTLHIKSRDARPDNRTIYGYNKRAGAFVKANGIRMYYETYGAGEPLVLLHGNGGSIASFSKQIAQFSKKYRVIAIDTRGQGNSTDTITVNFTYDQFAEDVKVILDSLNLKNVNVLGWSDGGNTALILASKYPGYVKNLITMGANLNPSEQAVRKKTLERTQKDLRKLEREKADAVVIKLMRMLLTEPNIAPESLKTVTARTLILAGERDEILEKHTRLIANSIATAQVRIIEGETHFVPNENPDLFNKIVLDFLAGGK